MGPEQLTGNETDDQLREKAENGISQILADIETGNIPDEYYDLDEYLRYVANETTPYDRSKTRKENDTAKDQAFQRLKRAAGAEGINSKGTSQHQLLEDLESEFKDKMGDIDVMNGAFTTEQLTTMLRDAVRAKAIKTSIFPVLRMLAFLKKGAHLEKLKTVENVLGLGALGKVLLSRMPPETLAFIQQVAKEKWNAVEIVQLAPMLLEMLKRPDYMLFNSSIKLESIDLTKNEDFFVSTDKPTIGATISPKIPAKSLESDLVILSIRNPALATHFIQTLRTVATSQAPKGRRTSPADFAFHISPNELAEKTSRIKQIADRHIELIASAGTTIARRQADQNEVDDINPYDTSPSAQERRNLISISKTIQQKMSNLEMSVSERNRTPGQKEDLEMWDMAIRFIKSCDDLKRFMTDFYTPLFENRRMKVIREQTAKRNPAYRNALYENIPQQEREASIREMGGEAECNRYIAIETAHATEEMLKHLVMTMYTDVIEAGGEPEVDFNAAVSKTVSGWSVSAKQMVLLISKRLTSIKTGAFGVAKNNDTTLIGNLQFAVAERGKTGEVQYDKHSKYINENGEERTVTTNEIEYRVESSNAAFAGLAQSLEMGFDTFNAMIEGSYAILGTLA